MLLIVCRLIVIYSSTFPAVRRTPLNIVVGRNLRQIRLRLALSQEELADACGLHRTYVGGIERGERNITLATLERLAIALGVDVIELILVTRR